MRSLVQPACRLSVLGSLLLVGLTACQPGPAAPPAPPAAKPTEAATAPPKPAAPLPLSPVAAASPAASPSPSPSPVAAAPIVAVPPNPAAITLPDGYKIEVLAKDLTAGTAMSVGPDGAIYVVESGSGLGGSNPTYFPVRALKIDPTNGSATQLNKQDLQVPALGILAGADGKVYVNDRERLVRLESDGAVTPLLTNLPSWGHGNDHMVWGTDGKIWFTQGSVTNSGVMGLDNQSPAQGAVDQRGFQFRPQAHDIPCQDVTLSGQNFETDDPRPGRSGQKASTGAYLPYGTASTPGQVVKGEVPCNGAVLKVNPDGSGLEWVAWGFRNPYGIVQAPDGPPFYGQFLISNNGPDVRGSRPIENAGDNLFILVPGGFYGWPDWFDGQPSTEPRFHPKEDPAGVPPLLAKLPSEVIHPLAMFPKGVSADGMAFSTKSGFGYVGDIFIGIWGPIGFGVVQKEIPGYNVMRVHPLIGPNNLLQGMQTTVFAGNVKNGPSSITKSGGFEHPIDVKFSPDGSALYVLDYGIRGGEKSGLLWKITKK
jgi:glucose/arabinose dehydrogenase